MLIRHKDNRIVNLDNVSNIFVEQDKKKVIFNMNYSVKIFGGRTERITVVAIDNEGNEFNKVITNVISEPKYTPDYTYWEYQDDEERDEIVKLLESKMKQSSWIFPENNTLRYVNIDCVSSISSDIRNNRIIFNLNYPVTHPKDDRKQTSDYVFYTFDDSEKFGLVRDNINFLVNNSRI